MSSNLENLLLNKMKSYFGNDSKRIKHAEKVLAYAKRILEKNNSDANIVIPAAILHDIGIKECEKKYNSTDGKLQEIESPKIAKKIMESVNLNENDMNEILEIIANHHSPNKINSLNFKIILDADLAVNITEDNLLPYINHTKYLENFFTLEGKNIFKELVKNYTEDKYVL